MSEKENQNVVDKIVDKVWEFLASIKLTIIIITVISLTSVVGTVLPQRAEPERSIQALSEVVGESFAPTAFIALDALGFTDMFRSWWFITFLFIFAANLIICSIDRFPKIWNMIKEPIKPAQPDVLNRMPVKKEAFIKGDIDTAKGKVELALKKIGFKPQSHSESGNTQIVSEKGRYSRLGIYVTHLSIIVLFIGVIIAMFWGFRGGVNILEGTSTSVVFSFGDGREIPLGFEVRCDNYDATFWEGTDKLKASQSWLTIIEDGKEVRSKVIDVNHPLRHRGITFYQSSRGFAPSQDSLFRFAVTSVNGNKENVELKFGESFKMPGTNIKVTVADFSPSLGIDQLGRLFTYDPDQMVNPAAFLEFRENDKLLYRQWVLRRYPDTWRVQHGIVEFKDLWKAQYTGLQARKDPGIGFFYLGSFLMTIGLYASFFMSHRRIWVKISNEKGRAKVLVAASSNKNREAFEKKIDELIKSLEG